MKIVSDHGFPKGSMPDDDAFDRFKNEREYIAKSGQMKTTVAAMDWAAAEIERLRAALKDIQREAMTLNPPRHSWYYDRAQNALANSDEPLVRDGLTPPVTNGDRLIAGNTAAPAEPPQDRP